jgi:hypothetical protein
MLERCSECAERSAMALTWFMVCLEWSTSFGGRVVLRCGGGTEIEDLVFLIVGVCLNGRGDGGQK